MKANRKFVNGDEAVSPVIAVILMVAITVVLAATVYLFVSGFGSEQTQVVTASFSAKAVDYPLGTKDGDNSDDAIEITYTSGTGDLSATDVSIVINGTTLVWDNNPTADRGYYTSTTFAAGVQPCTNSPGNDANDIWERGASLYLIKISATAAAGECDGADALTDFAAAGNSLDGIHQIKVIVRNQVVLDTQIEVHDDPSA